MQSFEPKDCFNIGNSNSRKNKISSMVDSLVDMDSAVKCDLIIDFLGSLQDVLRTTPRHFIIETRKQA